MLRTPEIARVIRYDEVLLAAYQRWELRERVWIAEGRPVPDAETAQQLAYEDWQAARWALMFG